MRIEDWLAENYSTAGGPSRYLLVTPDVQRGNPIVRIVAVDQTCVPMMKTVGVGVDVADAWLRINEVIERRHDDAR